jgi:hypothetical protein
MMPGGSSSQYGHESRGFSGKRYRYLHSWGANRKKKARNPETTAEQNSTPEGHS